jgi:hypothetical protein
MPLDTNCFYSEQNNKNKNISICLCIAVITIAYWFKLIRSTVLSFYFYLPVQSHKPTTSDHEGECKWFDQPLRPANLSTHPQWNFHHWESEIFLLNPLLKHLCKKTTTKTESFFCYHQEREVNYYAVSVFRYAPTWIQFSRAPVWSAEEHSDHYTLDAPILIFIGLL